MPELPEVETLARVIGARIIGARIASIELASLSALKTVTPSPTDLLGREVSAVQRFGKHIAIDASGLWLVVHLALAGWIQWKDELPTAPVRPSKGPLALRVGFVSADGEPIGGIDVTEIGTKKGLAVHVVTDPQSIARISSLGPDPLADDFTAATFDAILDEAGRTQIKGALRDQSRIAGIGNAYSDEILHVARISPFHPSASLDASQRAALFAAMQTTLREAIAAAADCRTGTIKAEKKAGMRVHGRAGQPCPACGDVVRSVSFADRSLEYCATCQTGGAPLADRRTSRFLK